MNFGKKLKSLRQEANFSQDDLAAKIDLDSKQISRYENGHFMPSPEVLVSLAKAFNVSLDYLLIDEIEKIPLEATNKNLIQKLRSMNELEQEESKVVEYILDAIRIRNQVKQITST